MLDGIYNSLTLDVSFTLDTLDRGLKIGGQPIKPFIPGSEAYLAPIDVLGLDVPPIMTPILVMPPNVHQASIIPLELFTPRHSLHFTKHSITFLSKREGAIPYVDIPGVIEHTHDPDYPTFENTPGFNVTVGHNTFAALFDSGVNISPDT